jgi:hypothetical protein
MEAVMPSNITQLVIGIAVAIAMAVISVGTIGTAAEFKSTVEQAPQNRGSVISSNSGDIFSSDAKFNAGTNPFVLSLTARRNGMPADTSPLLGGAVQRP